MDGNSKKINWEECQCYREDGITPVRDNTILLPDNDGELEYSNCKCPLHPRYKETPCCPRDILL